MIRPIDLRLRLVVAFLAIFIFTPVQQVFPATLGLITVLVLYAVGRQSIRWRRLLHLEGFLILLFIILPFSVLCEPVFTLCPFIASLVGFQRAFVLVLKITASVLLVSYFFASCDPMSVGLALRSLYVPESLVRLFIGVIRYLSVIQTQLLKLREAMSARAFRPKTNWHTWRSYGYLFGMLLLRSFERADRVEEAMVLRGYTGHFPRTLLPKPCIYDWLVAAIILLVALSILFLDAL